MGIHLSYEVRPKTSVGAHNGFGDRGEGGGLAQNGHGTRRSAASMAGRLFPGLLLRECARLVASIEMF